MRAVIYLRVSSDKQSTENQIPALEAMARQHGLDVVRVYSESETSWKAGHQRELAKAKVAASRHEFDVLLVWALDRLSRQGSLAMLQIIEYFKRCNVTVWSWQEPFTQNTNPATSELFYSFIAYIARMESDRRSERTLAGLAVARRKGKKLGRPKGRKDKQPRKKGGYYLRYQDKKTTAQNKAEL